MTGSKSSIKSVYRLYWPIKTILLVLGGTLLFTGIAIAQANIQDRIPSPDTERFTGSTDLLVPWRDAGCLDIVYASKFFNCAPVPGDKYMAAHQLSLFNADGSLFVMMDLLPRSYNYFFKNKDMIPFSFIGAEVDPVAPASFVFRLAGESEHWYKVVYNEDTGKIVYAPKFELGPDEIGMWRRSTYDFMLRSVGTVDLPPDHEPLLDAPNGSPVEKFQNLRFEHLWVVKLDKPDGEWIFVRDSDKDLGEANIQGWVRWRDGRKFLLGTIFNTYTTKSY